MNLLFDLYGVLLQTKSDEDERKLEEAIGSGPKMWEAFWRLRPDYDEGIISDDEFWRRMQDALKLEPFDYDVATATDFEGWLTPDDEVIEYVRKLHQEGHNVGILSNIPSGLAKLVREKHPWINELPTTFSCEIHVAKPDKRAYEAALEMMGSSAVDTHFFDDNNANIAAARNLGMKAHLFTGIDTLKALA